MDKIRYKTQELDDWTGVHSNWFNVREDGGEEKGINLDKVYSWSRLEEKANIVLVAKKKHQEDDNVAAKMVELKKIERI